MEDEYAGTALAAEVSPLREAIEEELASEDSAARENVAARLYHSGQDFVTEGYEHVGRAKLSYCASAYGGTPDDPGYHWAEKSREALEILNGREGE